MSSRRRPRVSAPRPDPARAALERLSEGLARAVVGQAEARTGLVLALVAGEHAYLEGPPGCGKTRLAEAFAALAAERRVALRFHRDVRESDLLGDPLLRHRKSGAVERIRFELEPGPLLRSEVAVLDDLGRAPGEALGPLLRVLAERRALGRRLPLETAVATALPPELGAGDDPIEPNQLDRFAVQVRMEGLLASRDWRAARELLESGERAAERPEPLTGPERSALRAAAARLEIGAEVLDALAKLLERLREAAPGAAQLSDRGLAGAAPRILRAHALLRGAERVELSDLAGLRFLLGRRVPDELRRAFPALLEELLDELGAAGARQPAAGAAAGAQHAGSGAGARVALAGLRDARSERPLPAPGGEAPPAADVQPLLAALLGRIERGRAERREHPGGTPRRYRRLRALDELLDADPLEAALFAAGSLFEPRVFERERRDAGGSLAVLRDVSASMEGRLSRWAGQVVAGIVRLGSRQHMRVGYAEFNHEAIAFAAAGGFFHRRYRELLGLAARRRAEGRTNYEAPLALALEEFRRRPGHNRHVVLLTDGLPVLGDPNVRRERALARRGRIRVHTVFLGLGPCPPVLDEISRETDGLCFVGRPTRDGRLRICERV